MANELDMLMAKNRAAELACIVDMASKLRQSATDVLEALSDVEGYLTMLKNMAVEVSISGPSSGGLCCGLCCRLCSSSMAVEVNVSGPSSGGLCCGLCCRLCSSSMAVEVNVSGPSSGGLCCGLCSSSMDGDHCGVDMV